MPFGLCTASYLVCKLMYSVIQDIRTEYSIIVVVYMFDILAVGPSFEVMLEQTETVVFCTGIIGLQATANYDCSFLVPNSVMVFLGVEIKFVGNSLSPPFHYFLSYQAMVKVFLSHVPCDLELFNSHAYTLNYFYFGLVVSNLVDFNQSQCMPFCMVLTMIRRTYSFLPQTSSYSSVYC